jgi:RNA polymerase sigma-70 factor (ECF subfamily)
MSGLDPGNIREAYERNRDTLFRFLFRLCRERHEAEDLLQETFLTVWRKRDQFEGRGCLEGYLRKTAYRTFLNHREKTRRRGRLAPVEGSLDSGFIAEPVCPASTPRIEDDEARGLLLARVRVEVDALPEAERDAFILFRYEGLTCAAIADAMDVPVKTVESRVRRATERLAARLSRYRAWLPVGRA